MANSANQKLTAFLKRFDNNERRERLECRIKQHKTIQSFVDANEDWITLANRKSVINIGKKLAESLNDFIDLEVGYMTEDIFDNIITERKMELVKELARKIMADHPDEKVFISKYEDDDSMDCSIHISTNNYWKKPLRPTNDFECMFPRMGYVKQYLIMNSFGKLVVLNQPCDELTTMRMIAGGIEIFQT